MSGARPTRPSAPDGYEVCFGARGCGETKPRDAFSTTYGGKDRQLSYAKSICKACHARRNTAALTPAIRRDRQMRSWYDITPAQWEDLLTAQGGGCALCERPEAECPVPGGAWAANTSRRLVIDHCHTTRAVRGLLCQTCNHFLGYVETLPAELRHLVASQAAVAYLAAPPAVALGLSRPGQVRQRSGRAGTKGKPPAEGAEAA